MSRLWVQHGKERASDWPQEEMYEGTNETNLINLLFSKKSERQCVNCHTITHHGHRSAMRAAFCYCLKKILSYCAMVRGFIFEPTRFFEEVEFAKSMSSAQENEVEVSFGILLIFRL